MDAFLIYHVLTGFDYDFERKLHKAHGNAFKDQYYRMLYIRDGRVCALTVSKFSYFTIQEMPTAFSDQLFLMIRLCPHCLNVRTYPI